MTPDKEQSPSVTERLAAWASQHSNVTPLDGTDRDSPTFGDLRALFDRITALHAEREKLAAENLELRENLSRWSRGSELP